MKEEELSEKRGIASGLSSISNQPGKTPVRGVGGSVGPRATEKGLGAIVWDLWMVALALGSLIMVAWVEFQKLTWPDPTFKKLALVDLFVVLICLAEFVYRLAGATDKKTFLKRNWYDLIGLVPMYAESLALLRAARIFRIVRVLRLLRVVYTARRLSQSFAFIKKIIDQSRIGYSFSVFGVVALIMAAIFWLVEHSTNHQMVSFDDSIWWAVTTAATVGYGDVTPTTGTGRILAIVLMLFGLGFIGVLTSSLSAALVFVGNHESEEERVPSLASELSLLGELKDKGLLTEEEFSEAKSKVLKQDA